MKNRRLIFVALLLGAVFFNGCKTSKTDLTQAFSSAPEYTEVVKTKNGPVAGIYSEDHSVELFAGIPFAKPPVGDLRWKEPEDADDWNETLLADHFAPVSMQGRSSKFMTNLFNAYIHSDGDRTDFAPMSEDCLYLNIWRPEGTDPSSKLPVLVYIHGGSLMGGSSWQEEYDGEALSKKGIVFVSVAYRTGVFGYFAHEDLAAESPNHTTGNYGLLDQIKALKWVNENISAFGGDVKNITIAGESAGSSSVNALCCSPLSKGLFRRAIGESSSLVIQVPSHSFRSTEDALKMGHKIMDEFNCSSIEELRKLPAEKLLTTTHKNNCMTVDPYAMPEYPWELYAKGQNHEEALLNGFNAREGFAFTFFSKINRKNYESLLEESPYIPDVPGLVKIRPVKTNKEAKQFYTDVFSVICFTYPHYSWSKVVTAQNRPVYEYYFSKENRCKGTNHSGELVYAYGNLKGTKNYTAEDYELENTMMNYWLNFIKTGNPNGENLPEWKTVKESNGQVLELGEKVYMRDDPFMDIYPFINFDIDKQMRPPTYGSKED